MDAYLFGSIAAQENRVLETVFRTSDLPAEERFDMWRELVSRTHAPLELDSSHRKDFRAFQRVLNMGDVLVWPTTFQPARFLRTPRLIRQSDPEVVHVSLPLSGALRVAQGGHEAACEPGTLCVIDSSRPVDVRGGEEGRPHTGIGLEVPRAWLPLDPDDIGRITSRRLSAREGFGALLAEFLRRTATDTHAYGPSDGPRLARLAADLMAALFAQALESERSLPPETHRRALILRIRAFIRQHLHDPHLTPRTIAAAHHISVRYLHRLFADEQDTVATFVRRQRLERARRDLSDPALRHVPVHDIAARWGFSHHAAFSRAFRAAFGHPPRDYRRSVLDGPS